MTKEEALQQLKALDDGDEPWDREGVHMDADNILCDLLMSLGCGEVAAQFLSMDLWYS